MKFLVDANKNQVCVVRDVGIREEICLIDANIGLDFPSHQNEKVWDWYSKEWFDLTAGWGALLRCGVLCPGVRSIQSIYVVTVQTGAEGR